MAHSVGFLFASGNERNQPRGFTNDARLVLVFSDALSYADSLTALHFSIAS